MQMDYFLFLVEDDEICDDATQHRGGDDVMVSEWKKMMKINFNIFWFYPGRSIFITHCFFYI